MSEAVEMTSQPLIEHLSELRKRVLLCFACFVIATCGSYFFASDIYAFLVQPLADSFSDNASRRLIYTGLTEAFFAYLKLAVFAGFLITFPVMAIQLYLFMAPGLYTKERHSLAPYLVAAPILFLAGASFVYYYIFPKAWAFFIGFETAAVAGGLPIELETRVADYLGLVMQLIIAFGVSFQLPVILVLLVKIGTLSVERLKKGRRYAIVIIVALSAIITPPDIFSQIALSVPLYLLYELSILFCLGTSKTLAKEHKDDA